MKRALVIAAHGSHFNAGTALPAWACVDAARRTGLLAEVTAAFWKEQPALGTVLESLRSDDIIIVPVFTSEGYFSQTVLPAELNPREGQRVQITRTAGRHEYFVPIVMRRIQAAFEKNIEVLPSPKTRGLSPLSNVSVVIVGHGTPRHDRSGGTTEHQAELLRRTGRFGEVLTAYLDEAPFIHDVYEAATFPTLVIVPFFIAEGLHTQADIPEALNLREPFYEPQIVHERQVIYTPPVGLEDDLYQVVLALAGENPAAPLTSSAWDAVPLPSSRFLMYETVGEVWAGHEHYLCHIADRDTAPENLIPLETPAAIRATLRFTDEAAYRPLATSRNLPSGWMIPAAGELRLAALETIYPGLDSFAAQPRTLQQVGLRQKGQYRPIVDVPENETANLVKSVCGNCVRHPVWHGASEDSNMRCMEPCSIFWEAALENMKQETVSSVLTGARSGSAKQR